MICKIILFTWITIETLIYIVKHGKELPIERQRYDGPRAIITWILVTFLLLELF